MAQIVVDALAKSFEVAEREPGMLGALRGLPEQVVFVERETALGPAPRGAARR